MQAETILLVEDEPILRQLLGESLQDDGYKVARASSADAAWEMVQNGLAFDILVTDVKMPGTLNGLDLAQLVYSHFPDARIIVMSGFASLEKFDGRLGIFLKKPFTPARLSATLAGGDGPPS